MYRSWMRNVQSRLNCKASFDTHLVCGVKGTLTARKVACHPAKYKEHGGKCSQPRFYASDELIMQMSFAHMYSVLRAATHI